MEAQDCRQDPGLACLIHCTLSRCCCCWWWWWWCGRGFFFPRAKWSKGGVRAGLPPSAMCRASPPTKLFSGDTEPVVKSPPLARLCACARAQFATAKRFPRRDAEARCPSARIMRLQTASPPRRELSLTTRLTATSATDSLTARS